MPQRRGRAEVAPEQQPAAIVAKRLCDLLLTFPASASGGVQWQVLCKKYEERHSARLNVSTLGHSTALGAASALLWDVLRLVDSDDVDNPVVAVEDGVALTPQPGLLGCWPSLYHALSTIVIEHGTPGTHSHAHALGTSSMLLSQLRPLLERHWHSNFDETGLGFRTEEGTFVRLKKMKHLLTAVIRWREERQAWRSSTSQRPTVVDEVLLHKLDLVPSTKHNDLVLVCSSSMDPLPSLGSTRRSPPKHDADDASTEVSTPLFSSRSSGSNDLQLELERLRAENEELRAQNTQMQSTVVERTMESAQAAETQMPGYVLDDPFEPPPEKRFWLPHGCFSDCGSTDAGSERACISTPTSQASRSMSFALASHCTSSCTSGLVTPNQYERCPSMTPVWFPLMPMPMGSVDVSIIPRGIVQSAREQFERISCIK